MYRNNLSSAMKVHGYVRMPRGADDPPNVESINQKKKKKVRWVNFCALDKQASNWGNTWTKLTHTHTHTQNYWATGEIKDHPWEHPSSAEGEEQPLHKMHGTSPRKINLWPSSTKSAGAVYPSTEAGRICVRQPIKALRFFISRTGGLTKLLH